VKRLGKNKDGVKDKPRPRFSLVIPTANRPATLGWTLRTCLAQDFHDYEIIVCDNCSEPATKALVAEFNSPKIRYHRSPVRLSMSDNWNLAYSLTRGEYVTFLGDDDAMMPYALRLLDGLLRETGAKAIRWDPVVYAWPDIARKDLANFLQIPLRREISWIKGKQAIRDVINWKLSGPMLPNVYHGLVARDTLESIKAKTGRIFGMQYCDTYSSFTVAYLVEEYLSISMPMSIAGFSGASNNIAFNSMRRKTEVGQNYRLQNAGSPIDSRIPDLPTHFVVLPESFLSAKADLFPEDESLMLDRRVLVDLLLNRMPIDTLDEWPAAVAEIRRSVSDDPLLLEWFERRLKAVKPKTSPRDFFRPRFHGFSGGRINFDVKKRGISNIAEATQFAAQIFEVGGGLSLTHDGHSRSFFRKMKIAKFLLFK